jgi:hypothetical protein
LRAIVRIARVDVDRIRGPTDRRREELLTRIRLRADVLSQRPCDARSVMRRPPRTIDLAPWPFDDRPRVLIEHPDPGRGLEIGTAIRQAGFAVGVCTGPNPGGKPATACPLHRLEPCVAVEGADLVVTALPLDTADGQRVVRGLQGRYPSRPLVVLATVGETLELHDVLTDCTVLGVDASPAEVAAAVADAIPITTKEEP